MTETKQRHYTTPEQKIKIINSPLSNVELAKIYGISNKCISQIRRRAGLHKTGVSGGPYNRKLTDEQIKEIIETTTPSAELAAKFNVTYEAVWLTRKKNGVKLPKKEQKSRVDLTHEQKEEVIKSKRSNIELSKIYGVTPKTISKIRIRSGKGLGSGNRSGVSNNKKLTESEINEIITSKESNVSLAKKLNVSPSSISRTKLRAGIISVKVIKKPKEKESIKQPIKKRTINAKKTTYEEEFERKIKAEKAAETYRMTEKEKLDSGLYGWQPVHPRGMALKRIA